MAARRLWNHSNEASVRRRDRASQQERARGAAGKIEPTGEHAQSRQIQKKLRATGKEQHQTGWLGRMT